MADLRTRIAVTIADPTTDANVAAVDANDNLTVVVNAELPAGTQNIGNVDIDSFAAGDTDADDDVVAAAQTSLRTISLLYGYDGTQSERVTTDAAGALDVNVTLALPTGANTIGAVNLAEHVEIDNAAVSVAGALIMGGLVFDDTTPVVVTEGDAGYQRMSADREAYVVNRDAAGNERGANVTASNELNVIASAQPGVDIGDVTILDFGTSLTDADDDVVADGQTTLRTINLLYGHDGTQWERLQSNATGALDVNVIAGGGESVPTTPIKTTLTSSALAAGSPVDLDGPEEGGNTVKVRAFNATATVPFKAELVQVDNDVDTIHVVTFGRAGELVNYVAPHRDFHSITFGATGGFDGWQVRVTNLDLSQAADVYATLYTED